MTILELSCAAQKYAWGKIGSSSQVAQLQKNNPSFELEEDQPYAELWFGTHPSGPSRIKETQELLSDRLFSSSEIAKKNVGDKVFDFLEKKNKEEGKEALNFQLPFLFKVLSVNKALSIQAHPDLPTARELHQKFPEIYKDGNHKPEMAIALTKFETLCQFRPFSEIVSHFKKIPQLKAVVFYSGEEQDLDQLTESDLPKLYSQLMRCPDEILKKTLSSLLPELEAMKVPIEPELASLVLKMQSQFPGDVGLFSAFFLNYVVLQPGEGVFLAANEPHAYIAGDCIECMACSDNVVRAGLTPKFKDIDTLCRILTYKTGLPPRLSGSRQEQTDSSSEIITYQPPQGIPEFQVCKCNFSSGTTGKLPVSEGPTIFFVYGGSGKIGERGEFEREVSKGSVFFVSSQTQVEVEVKSSDPVEIWWAACNTSMFSS